MQSRPVLDKNPPADMSVHPKRRRYAWFFQLIVILAAMAAAGYLRIVPLIGSVFSEPSVRLTGIDAYYYMRIVDNLVRNFPVLINFDPYMIYPGGDYIGRTPSFFAYMLAGSVRFLAGVDPAQQTVDSIVVFIPPVIGMLLVIPAYFIGRELAGRWAGAAGALIMAVMPGELLSRTMLGYTDHHGAEVLLSALFSIFFILAVKKGRQFTYTSLLRREFPSISHHVPYALFAGIFFGLYLITWQGALLYLLIIFIYLVLQFISDHLRGFPTDYLSKLTIICFLVAMLIMIPFSRDRLALIGLAAVMLTPVALNILSRLMSLTNMRRYYYPVAVAGVCITAGLIIWLAMPEVFGRVLGNLNYIFSWRMEQNVVGEMKPLLFPGGHFTLDMAWTQFGLVLYSGIGGLILLCCRAVRRGMPEHVYFAVMAVTLFFASLAMVRFAAYSGFIMAVLTGYLAGEFIATVKHSATENDDILREHNTILPSMEKHKVTPFRALLLVIAAVVITTITATSVIISSGIVAKPSHMPTPEWVAALNWMRENTPEPFGKAGYYYELYRSPQDGSEFKYPQSMYSVAAWIDYGYWVTRIAHRVPVSNPAQWRTPVCNYYLSQDQSSADPILRSIKSRYIIVDNRLSYVNDKFYAICTLTNRPESDYYELCWLKKDGKYQSLLVFYPQFYRSMLIRLYGFDGRQVEPSGTLVMSYAEKQLAAGQKFKEILDLKSFGSYAEAQSFITLQRQGDYSVIGIDPLATPVPLEELNGYKLVWQASQHVGIGGSKPVPEVKIFEFTAATNE